MLHYAALTPHLPLLQQPDQNEMVCRRTPLPGGGNEARKSQINNSPSISQWGGVGVGKIYRRGEGLLYATTRTGVPTSAQLKNHSDSPTGRFTQP